MTKISLKEGRVNQKIKTRSQILNAAKLLMSKNKSTSLEEVAREANVSRATIYRYFPNIDLLSTEASLDIFYQSPETLFNEVKGKDLLNQIHHIQNYYNGLAQDHEMIFRRYLSAVLNESIASKKKIRGARRVAVMELVLDSYKQTFSQKELTNLKNLSSILMGIDSLVVAKDVCGLTNKETDATLKWGIEMILKGLQAQKVSY